ncbi:MFS transporter [Actinocorallia populi]|uniref:MFS transporter n=1 Tax=Actinocorallia populi TaxID=2079200 RepID=UPI000D091F23|nr:MFS transporter [Actinocorallia populi]
MRTVPSSSQPSRPSLWRHRAFALLASAHAVSQVGSQISLVALPLLALTVLHASPVQIGLLTAAETAGFLLVGLPSGVWVDRMAKKPVLVVCDVIRALALGSLPVAHLLGVLGLPQLYAVALVTGLATVFFQVAYQSYLPVLVDSDRLVEGNTRLQTLGTAAEVAGPGLGGWLTRLVGAPVAIVLDAVSFLGSALLLLGIRADEPAHATERRGLWTEMREGLAFLARHRILRAVVAASAFANLFGTALMAMLPVFFIQEAGVDFSTYGMVLAAGSVGGVLGAMTTEWQQRLIGGARMLWLNAILAGLALLLVPLAEPGWKLGLAVAGLAVDGFFVASWAVASVSLRQTLTPTGLLGRVNATARFVNWGVMPAGALLGGLLTEAISARTALLVFGAGYLASCLPVLLSPLRGLRSLPRSGGVR